MKVSIVAIIFSMLFSLIVNADETQKSGEIIVPASAFALCLSEKDRTAYILHRLSFEDAKPARVASELAEFDRKCAESKKVQ